IFLNLSGALLPYVLGQTPKIREPRKDVPQRSRNRFVLILFDELDQTNTFERRPDDVRLEHFDDLRNQSIYAENAYSPAMETQLLVPSYLFGRPISNMKAIGFNQAIMTDTVTQETFDIATQPNLFSKAASAGSTTAVIGWYLPYCRIFAGPAYCSWEAWVDTWPLSTRALMFDQLGTNAVTEIPLIDKLGSLFEAIQTRRALEFRQSHIAAYERILADAKRHVADPNFNFIYVHMPVPHLPIIFDRHTGAWATAHTEDYSSNLVLADRTLGEIESAMKAVGVWDKTNVLVVGDHGWRLNGGWMKDKEKNKYRRVPFLLKLSGQRERLDFHAPFGAIVLHDFALLLLQKDSFTADDAVNWLMKHGRTPGRYEDYMAGDQCCP